MPTLPSFATERRAEPLLQHTDLQHVPAAVVNVLNWLDLLATALAEHRATPEYAVAVRKSGAWRQSGLTKAEIQAKKDMRAAKLDLHTATELAQKWNARQITFQTAKYWQLELLQAFWDGSLQERVAELRAPNPGVRSPYASIVLQINARK